jgi:NDP-sugar pyrophosphorylase family protein
LRLAAQGEKILAFRADEYYWRDLGKPENIAQAAEDLKQNVIALGNKALLKSLARLVFLRAPPCPLW